MECLINLLSVKKEYSKMKSVGLFLVVFSVICCFTLNAGAGENLEGWSKSVDSGTAEFTASGETVKVSITALDYDGAWAKWSKNFEGAYGAMASVKMDEDTGQENRFSFQLGFRMHLGIKSNGNPVLAQISFLGSNGERRIYYKIRERTPEGKTVKELAKGYLGDGSAWEFGEKVVIGQAMIGGELYFYSSKAECIVKIQPISAMDPVSANFSGVEIFGEVDGGEGNISGEVGDLMILK